MTFEGEGNYTVVGVLELTPKQDEEDPYEAFVPWTPLEGQDVTYLSDREFSRIRNRAFSGLQLTA